MTPLNPMPYHDMGSIEIEYPVGYTISFRPVDSSYKRYNNLYELDFRVRILIMRQKNNKKLRTQEVSSVLVFITLLR